MKKIGITQRVMSIAAYGERRDALDQRWASVAFALDFVAIPLQNVAPEHVPSLLDVLSLDALLLSGGNSLTCVEPEAQDAAPERDAFEAALIKEGIRRKLPILGICRGMQMLQAYFGGTLVPAKSGAGAEFRDILHVPATQKEHFACLENCSVNSYHDWAIDVPASELIPFAQDTFGQIEGFFHEHYRIAGMMWHPEREYPYKAYDLQLMRQFLW